MGLQGIISGRESSVGATLQAVDLQHIGETVKAMVGFTFNRNLNSELVICYLLSPWVLTKPRYSESELFPA